MTTVNNAPRCAGRLGRRTKWFVLVFLTCCAALIPTSATAQENRPWPERTFVTVDVPFQPLSNDFSESLRFADATTRSEDVTFRARYESTRGALLDAGVGVRVARNLGIGATASWFQRSASGSFDLAVPNPLAANRPLDLAGPVSGLNRREAGVHIQALHALRLGRRGRVMLAGGPSIFKTKLALRRCVSPPRIRGWLANRSGPWSLTTDHNPR